MVMKDQEGNIVIYDAKAHPPGQGYWREKIGVDQEKKDALKFRIFIAGLIGLAILSTIIEHR